MINKLTTENLVEIGENYGKVESKTLAEKFNVKISTIKSVATRLRKFGIAIPRQRLKIYDSSYKEAVKILLRGKNKRGRRLGSKNLSTSFVDVCECAECYYLFTSPENSICPQCKATEPFFHKISEKSYERMVKNGQINNQQ